MPSGASTAPSARDRLGNRSWTAAFEAVSAPSKPPRAGALRRFRLSCASVGCRFPLGSPVNPAGLPAGSRSSFGAKGKRPPGSCLACRRTPAGCQTSVLTPAGIWPTVWHPSRMRTDRPRGTGGRSPCSAPGTTTVLATGCQPCRVGSRRGRSEPLPAQIQANASGTGCGECLAPRERAGCPNVQLDFFASPVPIWASVGFSVPVCPEPDLTAVARPKGPGGNGTQLTAGPRDCRLAATSDRVVTVADVRNTAGTFLSPVRLLVEER